MMRKVLFAATLGFVLVFFVIPLAALVFSSFHTGEGFGFSNYVEFFRDGVSRKAFFRSLYMGGAVMLTALLISYPSAMAMNSIRRPGVKSFVMALAVLPLMTNPVARTFSWLAVIGREGLINNILAGMGLGRIKILYTETAVFLGLLQLFTPLMLLSLVSAFENLDEEIVLAAQSLGAGKMATFFKIQLPLTRDGAIMGSLLVFAGATSAYVTPAILGGSRILMLSTLLYQKAMVVLDWNMAITIAVVMITLTMLVNVLVRISLGRVGT